MLVPSLDKLRFRIHHHTRLYGSCPKQFDSLTRLYTWSYNSYDFLNGSGRITGLHDCMTALLDRTNCLSRLCNSLTKLPHYWIIDFLTKLCDGSTKLYDCLTRSNNCPTGSYVSLTRLHKNFTGLHDSTTRIWKGRIGSVRDPGETRSRTAAQQFPLVLKTREIGVGGRWSALRNPSTRDQPKEKESVAQNKKIYILKFQKTD